ncbi:hypothetical protein CCUS01_14516 [Colletotrichum cuscutae]|uniref:Uncharacterized protein n=1 Tax=Colletotrichum cuscutae TaxID=1209917 RepID=A0AAJ0DKV3_9PEZI|nr:hypothetical protein CCUS01_14516 [Colletotrichum cuscutae]
MRKPSSLSPSGREYLESALPIGPEAGDGLPFLCLYLYRETQQMTGDSARLPPSPSIHPKPFQALSSRDSHAVTRDQRFLPFTWDLINGSHDTEYHSLNSKCETVRSPCQYLKLALTSSPGSPIRALVSSAAATHTFQLTALEEGKTRGSALSANGRRNEAHHPKIYHYLKKKTNERMDSHFPTAANYSRGTLSLSVPDQHLLASVTVRLFPTRPEKLHHWQTSILPAKSPKTLLITCGKRWSSAFARGVEGRLLISPCQSSCSLEKLRETMEAHYKTNKKRSRKRASSVLTWLNGQTVTCSRLQVKYAYSSKSTPQLDALKYSSSSQSPKVTDHQVDIPTDADTDVHFTLLSGPFLTSYCTRKIDHNHEDDRIAFETHSTPESTNIAREQRGYRKAPGKDGIKGMSFMELPGHRLGMVGNWKSCMSVGITILETYLEGYMVAPIAMPYLPGVSSMLFCGLVAGLVYGGKGKPRGPRSGRVE